MLKIFYVVWGYLGNWSERAVEVRAVSKEKAAEEIRRSYSPDFAKKATLFITEEMPYVSSPEN